jgi:protein TonB
MRDRMAMDLNGRERRVRLWESFAVSVGLHAAIFLVGGLSLATQAEFGMEGSPGGRFLPKPPAQEVRAVDFLASEDPDAPSERVRPTPVPTREIRPEQAELPSSSTGHAYEIPSYLLNPPPPYPEEARRLGQEGKVLLQVAVNAQGEVTSVKLLSGSGHSLLDESAFRTVAEKWKFKPGHLGGIPMATEVNVPIVFRLDDR